MTSLVRPIAVSLLCVVAALGHAPAWLHVASCDHGIQRGGIQRIDLSSSDAVGLDCHHACCPPPANTNRSGEQESSGEPGHSDGDHHSESCTVCQSLLVPNGVGWKLEVIQGVRFDGGIANIPAVAAPESTSLSIAQPRGPPSLVS